MIRPILTVCWAYTAGAASSAAARLASPISSRAGIGLSPEIRRPGHSMRSSALGSLCPSCGAPHDASSRPPGEGERDRVSRARDEAPRGPRSASAGLEGDLLVGGAPEVARDQAEPGLRHPRAVTVQAGDVPDRREHGTLVHELLDALQGGLA